MRWWKVLGITHFSISVSLRRSSWSGQQLFSISSHMHKCIYVCMYTITQLLLYIILWFLSTFLYQWHIQRILDINSFIHIIFHKNLIATYWCVKDSNHTINKIKSCNCFLLHMSILMSVFSAIHCRTQSVRHGESCAFFKHVGRRFEFRVIFL